MAAEVVPFTNAAPAPRRSFDEINRMAEAIAKSRLFGVDKVEQVIALMLMAEAEGRHVASAMQDYSVIQGKPSLKAEAMLARFQQAGGHVKWIELTDIRVAAVFSHKACDPVTIDWDMTRAKQAGLGGKDMWKKFPRQMLRARVISEGVRTAFPGALGGMYAAEEVMDFEPARPVHTAVHSTVHDADGIIYEDTREALPAPAPSVPGAISASQVGRDMADAINAGEEPGLTVSERAKPKSPADQAAEKAFKALKEDLEATDSKAALDAWMLDNKAACAALPEPFKSNIRSEVGQHLGHWKRIAEEAEYAARVADEAAREFAQ